MAKRKTTEPKATPVEVTTAQADAYKKLVDKMLESEAKLAKGSVRVMYARGTTATAIMEKPDSFGKRSFADIAADLGCKTSTLRASVRLTQKLTQEDMTELEKLANPPSIRMLNLVMTIKDEAKQKSAIKKLKSGSLSNVNFVEQLREFVGRGPKRSRRPLVVSAQMTKLDKTTRTFVEQLTWLKDASDKIAKLDDSARNDTIVIVKQLQTRLRDAFEQLQAGTTALEAVIPQPAAAG